MRTQPLNTTRALSRTPVQIRTAIKGLGVTPRLALGPPYWRRALQLCYAIRFGGLFRMKTLVLPLNDRGIIFQTTCVAGWIRTNGFLHVKQMYLPTIRQPHCGDKRNRTSVVGWTCTSTSAVRTLVRIHEYAMLPLHHITVY